MTPGDTTVIQSESSLLGSKSMLSSYVSLTETLGVRVNDGGEGPFPEASVQIVGVLYRGKDGTRLRGFETWTDKDGDKLVWEIMEKEAADSPPGTSPGTAKVFSGTGKYVGMQGSMDWQLRYPKPFPEGTGRGICREEVKLVPSN